MRRASDRNSEKVSRLIQVNSIKDPVARASIKKKLLEDFAREDRAFSEGKLGQLRASRLAEESRNAIIAMGHARPPSADRGRAPRRSIQSPLEDVPRVHDIITPPKQVEHIPLNMDRRLSPAIKTIDAVNPAPLVAVAPKSRAPRAVGKCKDGYCNADGTFNRGQVSKRAHEIKVAEGKKWGEALKAAWREARH